MDDKKDKVKKNRSAAYPSTALPEAIEQLRQIHNDLGKGPYDRESAAKSLGYTGVSGASASKIAALVHYGLIQRVGGGYIETDLGTSIALPVDQDEESKALLEAFKSPALFTKLLNDFGGKSLPAKLEVILVRQYRITEQASKDVAKVFRESAEFVGVLKNGFLNEESDSPTPNNANNRVSHTANNPPSAQQQPAGLGSNEVAVDIGPGLKVVFSQELFMQLATGKFSKGIEQLTLDLQAISPSRPSVDMVGDDEEEAS